MTVDTHLFTIKIQLNQIEVFAAQLQGDATPVKQRILLREKNRQKQKIHFSQWRRILII